MTHSRHEKHGFTSCSCSSPTTALRSVNAHDQLKGLVMVKWKILTMSRSPMTVITANGEEATDYDIELDVFLTMKVLENTPAVLSFGKLCDENGYSYEWINGQKPHLMKNGIWMQCSTENFVPIIVQGLSTSSSSSSHPSSSMTPSRQERHCSTSSSSASSSPTTATSSEIQIREREDRTESDIWNRVSRCVLRSRSGCKNSGKIWWMMKFLNAETHTPVLLMKYLWSPHARDVRIWVNIMFLLISLKTEIARSASGPKLQGPVQKTQWRSRTSCRKFW